MRSRTIAALRSCWLSGNDEIGRRFLLRTCCPVTAVVGSRHRRYDLSFPFRCVTDSTANTSVESSNPLHPTVVSVEPENFVIPESFYNDLQRASVWQDKKSEWNIDHCRSVVAQYDAYLQQLVDEKRQSVESKVPKECIDRLLSADTVTIAFKVLTKCKVSSADDLSASVRQWERYIGQLGRTPLTDHLSLRLLTANAKSGNLGRSLSLLELRAQKNYRPRDREFLYAITAIQVAAGVNGRKNIFLPDREQPALDNPTRWLDAILLHMKQRQQPLTTAIANRMLHCYSGTGYTGKASHHFYRIARLPVKPNSAIDMGESDKVEVAQLEEPSLRPRDWFFVPELGRHDFQPAQVKLTYNRVPPPYFKVPAQVQGKLLFRINESNSEGRLRLELESEPDFSIPLSAAFAFAHSLQQGACGHEPVVFNVDSYNALIKACVYRGALWRAMNVLDTVIRNATSDSGVPLKPNLISYNLVLAGLSRVGDVITAQRFFHKMLNEDGLEPDAFTVRAIVDGLLNLADAPAAITVVQDFFNQHSVLPPYTTHCKILEFCLARGMIYEAKRYVYFIQQLWYWKPVESFHSPKFMQMMRATQHNTQLQKPALQNLFAYFGETLDDSDFL
jgi:pentatricopeptide repeat protein